MTFEYIAQVTWAQLDSNAHMANTAYLDVCVDARFAYFSSRGIPPAEFARLRIGPAVRRDEVDYFREMHLQQTLRVNCLLAGISDDASRFRLRNEIFLPDGALTARITTTAGWFDLVARKLTVPPDKLADAMRALDRTDDFQALESSVRK